VCALSTEAMMRDMRNHANALALLDVVMGFGFHDRKPALEAMLEGIRAGQPVVPFGNLKQEAKAWAQDASERELKVYLAEIYNALSAEARAAFIQFATRADA
jgi:hypothetical protein